MGRLGDLPKIPGLAGESAGTHTQAGQTPPHDPSGASVTPDIKCEVTSCPTSHKLCPWAVKVSPGLGPDRYPGELNSHTSNSCHATLQSQLPASSLLWNAKPSHEPKGVHNGEDPIRALADLTFHCCSLKEITPLPKYLKRARPSVILHRLCFFPIHYEEHASQTRTALRNTCFNSHHEILKAGKPKAFD